MITVMTFGLTDPLVNPVYGPALMPQLAALYPPASNPGMTVQLADPTVTDTVSAARYQSWACRIPA